MKQILIAIVALCFLLTSCKKDGDTNIYTIQQGTDIVQIGWMKDTMGFAYRQNKVVSTSIDLKVQVTFKDSTRKILSFQVPANYNNWIFYGNDNYVIHWSYEAGYQDSITNTISNPQYKKDLESYAYLKIVGITTSDKSIGFQIIDYDDQWNYTKPNEPYTTISFNGNGINIYIQDYHFLNNSFSYYPQYGTYAFIDNNGFTIQAAPSTYPLKVGDIIPFPLFQYTYNNINYGTRTVSDEYKKIRKNTIQMRVTSVRDSYFDADFSGKIWYEGHLGDSTIITNGRIENMQFSSK